MKFFFLFLSFACAAENIQVYKNGVLHQFVPSDERVNYFAEHAFPNWEKETFAVFEQVKDPQSIAIDLGAWIGTTAIWLSHNFYHVLAVEPDIESVECLRKNLEASGCHNVTLCGQPISNLSQEVIFGTRENYLNSSISYIKPKLDNISDYVCRSLTFKQLVFDYLYAEKALTTHKIGFIKCDIEGGEEDILEDLLHFAYNNKCKAFISFHLDWWKTKKIEDFAPLFKYFTTNCPIGDVWGYLKQNPFASLLFIPRSDAGVLVKDNITALIIGYNQITYIRDMVKQLEKYTKDIVIVDNASTFPPLLNYYANDFPYTLLRQKSNLGHLVYLDESIQKLAGDLYILTDPDLKFNANLPDNFIQELIEISNYFGSCKVGPALCINADDLRTDINIRDAEEYMWQFMISYPPNQNLEVYRAGIDTTFCLINKAHHAEHLYLGNGHCHDIRVAGHFTCLHRPWHKNYRSELMPGEFESYMKGNISTHYFEAK